MVGIVVALFAVALLVAPFLWAITHTFSFGHSGGSVSLSDSVSLTTGVTAVEASFTVAGSTTDQEEAIAFDVSSCLGVYIKTDQDLTLETNANDHTGGQLITLKAGIPFVWVKNSGITNPFTLDVVTTFWTNGGSSTATVYVRVLDS